MCCSWLFSPILFLLLSCLPSPLPSPFSPPSRLRLRSIPNLNKACEHSQTVSRRDDADVSEKKLAREGRERYRAHMHKRAVLWHDELPANDARDNPAEQARGEEDKEREPTDGQDEESNQLCKVCVVFARRGAGLGGSWVDEDNQQRHHSHNGTAKTSASRLPPPAPPRVRSHDGRQRAVVSCVSEEKEKESERIETKNQRNGTDDR